MKIFTKNQMTAYLFAFIFILVASHCFSQPVWITSGTSIGDTSVYLYYYKTNWTDKTQTHNSNNDDIVRVSNVDVTGTTSDTIGIHIYRMHLAVNVTSVTNNGGRAQFNHAAPRDLFSVGDSLRLSGFTNYSGWDTVYAIVNDMAFVMDIPYTADDAGTAERLGVPDNTTGITGLGSNDRYFGVFVTDNITDYDFTYNYAGNPYVSASNENSLLLFKRDAADVSPWSSVTGQTLDITNDTIGAKSQHTEFILGSSDAPLPIELLSFNALPEKNPNNNYHVLCSWTTATETNNNYFVVEKGLEPKDKKQNVSFTPIGKVKAAGNSSSFQRYEFIDYSPFSLEKVANGLLYYRLKQVDFDGYYKYSKPVTVIINADNNVNIYPNPVVDEINIYATSVERQKVTIEITDILGRNLFNKTASFGEGENKLQFANIADYEGGVYMLTIKSFQTKDIISKKRIVKMK